MLKMNTLNNYIVINYINNVDKNEIIKYCIKLTIVYELCVSVRYVLHLN